MFSIPDISTIKQMIGQRTELSRILPEMLISEVSEGEDGADLQESTGIPQLHGPLRLLAELPGELSVHLLVDDILNGDIQRLSFYNENP